jgi:hypothetical protein
MSWTYTGNPEVSKLDECRFMIGDTDASHKLLQDEEIEYLIKQSHDNDNLLFYSLFMRAATIYAKEIKRTLGPQSEDPTSRVNFFKAQAASYKAKLASASGLSLPKYGYPKIFRKGMDNNPPWPIGGGRYVR